MRNFPFKSSPRVSIGVELEFQLVDPYDFNLISIAKDLIRAVSEGPYKNQIKPEITQSMIEINSSIHLTPHELEHEFAALHDYLLQLSEQKHIQISGGGTHAFQEWSAQKIFPLSRYRNLSRIYRYLSKRATVFGQHIHIGCTNGDDAIYLSHALSRYVQHFIVLSASSPFYQGIDTGFNSSRLTVLNAFPQSGIIPFATTWKEFSVYFNKMRRLKIVKSMKDFYWDVRPKPEFGTVEIRLCDTPLSMRKAVMLAAYAQVLADYIFHERPVTLQKDMYDVYAYNRFQAARYGFSGCFIHPTTLKNATIANDMRDTLEKIGKYAEQLGVADYIELVRQSVFAEENDTSHLKEIYHRETDLAQVVKRECEIWKENK